MLTISINISTEHGILPTAHVGGLLFQRPASNCVFVMHIKKDFVLECIYVFAILFHKSTHEKQTCSVNVQRIV